MDWFDDAAQAAEGVWPPGRALQAEGGFRAWRPGRPGQTAHAPRVRTLARFRAGAALQAVAQTSHRSDPNVAALEFLAQAVDVDLNRVVTDLFAPAAEVLNDLLLAHQSAVPLEENFQKREFARGEFDLLVGHPCLATDLIVAE